MRAKKIFCVVVYDITDNKNRDKLVKIIAKYGSRINLSVFECMFTAIQLERTKEKTAKLIKSKNDQIVFYPICLDCFSKITYQPRYHKTHTQVVIF